jgi:hypothetical protein|tara:strand:+ start:310 stop:549 length:240 start_codon:yes stop_codon:yes gene_type:complete
MVDIDTALYNELGIPYEYKDGKWVEVQTDMDDHISPFEPIETTELVQVENNAVWYKEYNFIPLITVFLILLVIYKLKRK